MAYVIDQAHCSCCHRCRVECPVQAIRFKGSKYWISSAAPVQLRLNLPQGELPWSIL